MPWSQTMPMDQRVQFIADYLRDTLSMTELCNLYNVSRKTGYKINGSSVTCGVAPSGLRRSHAKLGCRPIKPPTPWWRQASRLAATIPVGELRNCSRS